MISIARNRPTLRYFARLTLLSLSALVMAAFALTSLASVYEPGPREFQGYITILGEMSQDQEASVSLRMLDDGTSRHPSVALDVALCGEGSVTGVLLLGGDAALVEIQPVLRGEFAQPKTYNGNLMNDGLEVGFLDDTQGFYIVKEALPACPPGGLGDYRDVVFAVEGRLGAPIAEKATVLGISAPRSTFAFPQMGAFDSPVPKMMLGRFTLPGESRDLVRPQNLTLAVDGVELSGSETIESVEPSVDDVGTLQWITNGPVAPTARVLNREAQVSLLQANAILAIGFGIAASVLSAFLIDWLREPFRPAAAPAPSAPNSREGVCDGRAPHRADRWARVAVSALGLGIWVGLVRRAGRRHSAGPKI